MNKISLFIILKTDYFHLWVLSSYFYCINLLLNLGKRQYLHIIDQINFIKFWKIKKCSYSILVIRGHLIVPNSMVSEIGQLENINFYILLDLIVNRNIRTVFIVKLYVYTIVAKTINFFLLFSYFDTLPQNFYLMFHLNCCQSDIWEGSYLVKLIVYII